MDVDSKKGDFQILVTQVLEDTPAAKAGISVGDRIVKLTHTKIEKYSDLLWKLENQEEVHLELRRKGKKIKVHLTPLPAHTLFPNMPKS